MTSEKVSAVFTLYRNRILLTFPKAMPHRMDVAIATNWNPLSPVFANHLLYMCEEGLRFVDAERLDKAFRWLGFIQGVFAVWGVYSIEEMGKHNMPDPDGTP